jgi:tetratricopeptide (TPR) repeat protein
MCYRHIEDAPHEADCYKELVEMAPDNLSYTYGLGRSLMEQGKFEEALPYFYKIDVMDENNIKAWRGIGWCCFILDKLEQAQKYYDKLTASSKPDINDWLNAGHVAWCQGHIQQALQYYKKGAETGALEKTIPNPFYDMFKNDFGIMQKKGFSETDLLLMRELV